MGAKRLAPRTPRLTGSSSTDVMVALAQLVLYSMSQYERRVMTADAVYADTSVLAAPSLDRHMPNRVKAVNTLTVANVARRTIGTSIVTAGELIGRLNRLSKKPGMTGHPVNV